MSEPDINHNRSAEDFKRMIETARWHILRYDQLRGSIANRASFLISANAVLIGGVALLFPKTVGQDITGGRPILATLAAGALLVLGLSALSVLSATKALLAGKTWRSLYGTDPQPSMFYQHSDTVEQAPNFAAFDAALLGQSLDEERKSATVNLWVVLQTHNYRYKFLRKSTRYLQLGLAVFVSSVAAVIVLSTIEILVR
ncbi:hypothetical protein [Verrucosispora sp. WMMC514]|uniref:hypothetical protein n=1 Tax=Verrucosispora sp. WMMC514 TaxID=3015156 RepID=UPI00248C63A8|nr:hypothetical protein [Verrucosispora sp. WMMC514]WBB91425.1 hypothetical protein O7597_31460 [Verrucosispora sp. WMMC514]